MTQFSMAVVWEVVFLYFVVILSILIRYKIYLLSAIELPHGGSSTVQ